MLLAGVTADIGCFAGGSEGMEFADKFGVFAELAQMSLATWSFSAEIGIREAFGRHEVLCGALEGFRELMLMPRLFTTGRHFGDRGETVRQLEELSEAGLQQIFLRVNEEEAAALPSDHVRNLVEGCHAGGVDLKLQFELRDAFTEDCCRIARTVEDRQFTVTVLPVRIRPRRCVPAAEAAPIERSERVQLVLDETGEVVLRRQINDEVLDVIAGNAQERRLRELVTEAPVRR